MDLTNQSDIQEHNCEIQWELMVTRPTTALPIRGRASRVRRLELRNRIRKGNREQKGYLTPITNAPHRLNMYNMTTVDFIAIQMISPGSVGTFGYVSWTDATTLDPCRMALIPKSVCCICNPLPYIPTLGTGGVYIVNSTPTIQDFYVYVEGSR